jgi:hypothetical protein
MVKKRTRTPAAVVLKSVTISSSLDWAYHDLYKPKNANRISQYP